MKGFVSFLKKECLEGVRSGKLMILGILFFAFGVMNPAIAKLTPWLMELMAEELAESGMIVGDVTVDALTSWVQFYKNVPMLLIAFVLIYGGILSREYDSGALVLMLTKGVSRAQIVLAKLLYLQSIWTVGYWLTYGVTFGYNAYFWDNAIAPGAFVGAVAYWLFGAFTVALVMLFSVLLRGYGGVVLGTGATVLGFYLLGLIPKLRYAMPTALMGGAGFLTDAGLAADYIPAFILAAVLTVAAVAVCIPLINKKQI